MKKRNRTVLLLIDNFLGHTLDFSSFKKDKCEIFGFEYDFVFTARDIPSRRNQTVKERYKSYLRNDTIQNDKLPTLAGRCIAISDIMKNMDKELVKVFWKIPS